MKSIPLLSWKECTSFHPRDKTQIHEKIYTEADISDKSFALVTEESELDFFPENSILVIDPEANIESGDYVIVAKSEHGSTASIKKYIVETDQIYLKSLVTGIGIVPLTTEYDVLGVIVQYKVDLKRRAREKK